MRLRLGHFSLRCIAVVWDYLRFFARSCDFLLAIISYALILLWDCLAFSS